jgi:phenolic acid decarboxylase
MRLLIILTVLTLTGLSSALAKEPYIGNFLYQYEGGNAFRVSVPNDKKLTWKGIAGVVKGTSGTEKPQRFKVADGIYYVTWIESTGINVSQAVNYHTGKVFTTVINGRERIVHAGTVTREK